MKGKPRPEQGSDASVQPGASQPGAAWGRPGRGAGADAADAKAECASAGLVIQALVKADRGFSLYLPNNPLHEKFFEEFRRRFETHLDEFGPLRLELTHDSLVCRGQVVYTNADLRDNLAFRMHADGIRALRIDDGIEAGELRTLVEILRRPAAEDGDDEDDIVTRLWSADLPHVAYLLAEVPTEGGAAPLGTALTGSRSAQEGALRRYAAELAAAAPEAPLPPPVSKQIFTITEEDLAALQELLAEEERRTPLEDMACILEAVIAAEREPAVLAEFLEIVARLCGDLMIIGRVDQAVVLLSLLSRTAAHAGLPAGHAATIEAARERVLTPDVVAGLSRLLTTGGGLERETLRDLVAALGRPAIEPFCRLLGEVPGKETRKVLIEALAEAGRGSPEPFLPFLLDARWYLVRNTIYILRRIAGPEAARAVGRCAGHQDLRVRKEVILYFDETGDPAGDAVLLGFLADGVPALRIAAARSLARRGLPAAADRLFALTAAPGFADRALLERETVWEALGAVAPARAFPILKEMLLRQRWFGKAKELKDIACACAGLKRIGNAAALAVLRQAAAGRRGESRELVEKTLRSIAPARGRAGPAGSDDGRG